MKIIFLTFFVSFLVTVAHCDDAKVKELKVDNKVLLRPRFIRASKRYYIPTGEVASFVGAVIACKTGGMTLATVNNEDAQNEIYNATLAVPYRNRDGYWIGAASSNRNSNNFYWINDAIRLIYTNWGTNQPRYDNGFGYGGCVQLGNNYKVDQPSKWATTDCSRLLSYVCEF